MLYKIKYTNRFGSARRREDGEVAKLHQSEAKLHKNKAKLDQNEAKLQQNETELLHGY